MELETSQQGQEEEGMDSRESEPGETKGISESGKTGQGNNSESNERTSSEANWLFSVIELEVEIYDIEEEIKQRPGINLRLEAERARLVKQLEALEQKTPYIFEKDDEQERDDRRLEGAFFPPLTDFLDSTCGKSEEACDERFEWLYHNQASLNQETAHHSV